MRCEICGQPMESGSGMEVTLWVGVPGNREQRSITVHRRHRHVVGTALGVRYVDMEANPLAVETYDAKVTRARDDRELWDLSREFASGAIAEGWE